MHPYTVYARKYRLLPTPPLPTERQKSIPEVSFNFTSSTGLWSFFKRFFAYSSFGLSVVLSLFSIAEQPFLTRTSTGDMLMRDSNAVSRSLVVSFFIQRNPQAKSTTNERKDGLIEGRKSTKRWDFEELTETIFHCKWRSFAVSVRHTGKRKSVESCQNNLIL